MFVGIAALSISILNFVAVSALLFLFVRYFKGGVKKPAGPKESAGRNYADLLERIKRIEKEYPSQALAKIDGNDLNIVNDGANRIKKAVQKLRQGSSPDKVRQELGYSRSEIGIIMASNELK